MRINSLTVTQSKSSNWIIETNDQRNKSSMTKNMCVTIYAESANVSQPIRIVCSKINSLTEWVTHIRHSNSHDFHDMWTHGHHLNTRKHFNIYILACISSARKNQRKYPNWHTKAALNTHTFLSSLLLLINKLFHLSTNSILHFIPDWLPASQIAIVFLLASVNCYSLAS